MIFNLYPNNAVNVRKSASFYCLNKKELEPYESLIPHEHFFANWCLRTSYKLPDFGILLLSYLNNNHAVLVQKKVYYLAFCAIFGKDLKVIKSLNLKYWLVYIHRLLMQTPQTHT